MALKTPMRPFFVTLIAGVACAIYVLDPAAILRDLKNLMSPGLIVVRAKGSGNVDQQVFYADEDLELTLTGVDAPETAFWIIDGCVQANQGLVLEHRFSHDQRYAASRTKTHVILVVYALRGRYRVIEKRIFVKNTPVFDSGD